MAPPNKTVKRWHISAAIGRFTLDRRVLGLLIAAGIVLTGRNWLEENPQHNPWAPLDLRDPVGWATATKIAGLRDDVGQCRSVLERSDIPFKVLEPAGERACARPDRTRLASFPMTPRRDPATCQLNVGLQMWLDRVVEPTARDSFGQGIAEIQQLGIFSCRRMYGGSASAWSEHATGNAIDVAGFVLEDGTTISIVRDWDGDEEKTAFLRQVRDGACNYFATTLSPDYNAAHRDHFHLDQASRGFGSACR